MYYDFFTYHDGISGLVFLKTRRLFFNFSIYVRIFIIIADLIQTHMRFSVHLFIYLFFYKIKIKTWENEETRKFLIVFLMYEFFQLTHKDINNKLSLKYLRLFWEHFLHERWLIDYTQGGTKWLLCGNTKSKIANKTKNSP